MIDREKLITLGVKKKQSPPSFEEAKNRRQKVRAAGLHPDYWYPVEWDANIKRGQVVEVKFWGQSIALWRGEDGQLHAVEDRCPHRQLKLSKGVVEDCNLTCVYHGWEFDGKGRCVQIRHDLFGSKMPNFQVGSFPLQVRYGLVWIFPGDPALASEHKLPDIPEIEGDTRWGVMPADFVLGCHHSMIIDNVSDFTHAYLHRKHRPFWDAKLTGLETVGDSVRVSYETLVGTGKIAGLFVDRTKANTNAMKLAYEYPYQWSNTDEKIKHWLFVLPMDERTSRAFFIFYFSPEVLKVPLLPVTINFPKPIMDMVMKIARTIMLRPLLGEDKYAVEAEQVGYEEHFEKPTAEINPCVRQFQALTIRKWEEFVAQTQKRTPAAQAIEELRD